MVELREREVPAATIGSCLLVGKVLELDQSSLLPML